MCNKSTIIDTAVNSVKLISIRTYIFMSARRTAATWWHFVSWPRWRYFTFRQLLWAVLTRWSFAI